MEKERTHTKIKVNIWGRDKQFLRKKHYIISIYTELISYQRLRLQPKSNICFHNSTPGHADMLKACREHFYPTSALSSDASVGGLVSES